MNKTTHNLLHDNSAVSKWRQYWIDDTGFKTCFNRWHQNRQKISEPIFGFELEVEMYSGIDKLVRKIHRDFDDIDVCADESLKDGFEIKSIPATYDYFNNRFNWEWLELIAKSDFNIHWIGEKAFHIHTDKSIFDDDAHISRFEDAVLAEIASIQVEWNPDKPACDTSQQLWQSVWAKPTKQPKSTWGSKREIGDGRYHSVNLTDSTVELRCFAPTLFPLRITKYMKYISDTITQTREN